MTLGALRARPTDLTQLDNLAEPLIVFQLQQRFAQRNIYTDIGHIVVSINPLVPLPHAEADKYVPMLVPNSCLQRRVFGAQAHVMPISAHGSTWRSACSQCTQRDVQESCHG